MKRWMTFKVLIWAIATLAIMWFIGVPLLKNEIARRTWKEIPCKTGTISYRFIVDGRLYMASRRNFWQLNEHNGQVPYVPIETDTTCWFNPADPTDAVLRLDTPTNWSLAWGQIMNGVLVLGGAFLLTTFGLKKPRPSQGAPGPGSAPGGQGP